MMAVDVIRRSVRLSKVTSCIINQNDEMIHSNSIR
jgi:hypothetical protein